jgi:perosamine synthetase
MVSIPRFRPSLSLREAAAFVGSAWPSGGDPGEIFERGFSRQCLDGRRVVLAPSARVALYWLLRAIGLRPGDEVVTQAFNFPAVPAAILAAGGTPRFLDLGPGEFEADWGRLEPALGARTRAVLLTHLYGNPADLESVATLCAAKGLPLVEDCAQGIGATWRRRPVGTFGCGAIFSLGPTKNLTLLGGGAVATDDEELGRFILEEARRHARTGPAGSARLATKALALAVATHPLPFSALLLPLLRRLERRGVDLVHRVMAERAGELEGLAAARLPSRAMAAVGTAQLRRLPALNRARVRNGWYLRARLADLPLTLPAMREGSVFMSFPVLHPRRAELALKLRTLGVDTDFGFMEDCSSTGLFGASPADFPQSARVAREILHLPVYPTLTTRQLDRIAAAVREAVRAL